MGYLKRTWAALVAKVDIPKPKAWPPPEPGDQQRVSELLEYGAKRDPVGDKVQSLFLALFLFMLPIDTVPASVAFIALVIHSILRTPSTWRCVIPLCRAKGYLVIFLWPLWLVISLLWSTNPTQGIDHAGALWALTILIICMPLLQHWRVVVAAFLAGVFFQNCAQLTQLIYGILTDVHDLRLGGFNKHYGISSLFMASASIIYLTLILFANKHKWYIYVGLLFSLFGLLIAQGRGVWIGFVCTLLYVFIYKIVKLGITLRGFVIGAVFMAIASVFAGVTVGPSILERVGDIPDSITRYQNGDIKSGNEKRLHWWRFELEKAVASPTSFIIGQGLGSTSSLVFPDKKLNTSHPHNMFVQTIYENGLIGLALLCITLLYPLRSIKTGSITSIAISGIALLWICSALFEGLQNSGLPLSLLCLLIVLTFKEKYSNAG